MMLWGLAALGIAAVLAHLLRRHETILRLQGQVLKARLALEGLLRQRRELVSTWCSLCEERGLLPGHIQSIRRSLGRLSAAAANPAPAPDLRASFMEDEKTLSRLIREAYVQFLDLMQDEGPHKDFFQQYYNSLTRFEKDIWDAQELYNDAVRLYNAQIRGVGGWLFRRWDHLSPLPPIPAPGPDRPRTSGGPIRPSVG
jgi:hypothetical protein